MFKEVGAQFTEQLDAFSSILNIFLGVITWCLSKSPANKLQFKETSSTLPVGSTGMSLICLELRRAKSSCKLARECTFESTHYLYVDKSTSNTV